MQTFGDKTRIIFRQKKTGGQEYLDINTQAEAYLGERRKNTDRVFVCFKYNSQTLLELRRWALFSGITKDFTFHAGRHTFASLTLTKGVSIENVSKMLGHTNIKTTQIYARITDVKVSNDMASFAEKLEEKKVKSKSNLDKLFECLSLGEKMALFNLPSTLSNDPERVKRISMMWHSLSEEEKTSLWANTFEKEDAFTFKPMMKAQKLAVNQ